ncbi:MAG: type II 3-dehydroquinate dehydratase [Caldisericia bacterium]|jgi:3-dehydroquinate dehydratase-2|nr:type II 3-dehydroquinate dehydratase [Caldisericia bacterium]
MKKILVINGPNLNLLGKREKGIYGEMTLEFINRKMEEEAKKFNFSLTFFQSNSEGEIIDKIQEGENFDGIIINPGGYSHTSIAILDAIKSINTPVIEVHLSNIFSREDFRQKLLTAKGAKGVISGLGYIVYLAALYSLNLILNEGD